MQYLQYLYYLQHLFIQPHEDTQDSGAGAETSEYRSTMNKLEEMKIEVWDLWEDSKKSKHCSTISWSFDAFILNIFFNFLYLQGITLKGERALPPWLNMQKVSPFGTDTNTTREWTTSAENYYYNQKNHQLFLYPNIIFHFLFSRLHSGTDLSELAVSL